MSDAPERIRILNPSPKSLYLLKGQGIEYVRADLFETEALYVVEYRNAYTKKVSEVAALEQERAEWVECAKLLGFKEVEIRRLRAAIREFIDTNEVGEEEADYWLTPLYRALTKPEGEQ